MERADTEVLVHPFPPLYDADSEVLILGSFPSVVSRQQSFYYANRSNRFWSVLAQVFQEDITDRRAFCLAHHIALWDVIGSCRIHGSSDASITDITVNDIPSLVDQTEIRTVFTTGAKARDLYHANVVCSARHIALPSTSSANARMRLEDLVQEYRIIREVLDEES